MFVCIVPSEFKVKLKEEIGYHFSWVLKLHCAHTFQLNRTNKTKIKRSMHGSQTNEFEVNKRTYQHSNDTKKINISHENVTLFFIAVTLFLFPLPLFRRLFVSIFPFSPSFQYDLYLSIDLCNYHDQQIVHMKL